MVNFAGASLYVTDAALRHLAAPPRCHHIASLDLTDCGSITDEGVRHLAGLGSLASLSLCHCDKVTDLGLGYLTKLAGSLASLDLTWCDRITGAGLEQVARLILLTHLDLTCTAIEPGLAHLRTYASRAVQFHPDGGQFDFAWLSLRTY